MMRGSWWPWVDAVYLGAWWPSLSWSVQSEPSEGLDSELSSFLWPRPDARRLLGLVGAQSPTLCPVPVWGGPPGLLGLPESPSAIGTQVVF